jgi:hypothetical protein
MKPATTSADDRAFSVQKSIFVPDVFRYYSAPKIDFEFALWVRKITILGALAMRFHEMSGLAN